MAKREFTRVRVAVEAHCSAGRSVSITGVCRDLSMKGLFLECAEPLGIGADCEVAIALEGAPQTPAIRARARVVRHDETGFALEFQEIVGLESFYHLQNLVRHNAKEPGVIDAECAAHVGLRKRT